MSVSIFVGAGLVALTVWITSMVSFGKRRPAITKRALIAACGAFALALLASVLAATTSGAIAI